LLTLNDILKDNRNVVFYYATMEELHAGKLFLMPERCVKIKRELKEKKHS